MRTIGSWNIMEGVASLVKVSHRNGSTNIIEREISLAYGLKDKKASKLHLDVHVVLFHVWLHKHALNHKY